MRGETLRLTPVAALICAFQSTPPRARGDEGGADATPLWYISIRSPLTRGDHEQLVGYLGQNTISIHFPHTRGDEISVNVRRAYIISIHSPLTRGDLDGRAYELRFDNISIRSPHARGDDSCPGVDGRRRNFNPLPSYEGRQHKPPKIHPNLRQLTQQNHDTPLFGALQAPFCGAEPDIRGAERLGKP